MALSGDMKTYGCKACDFRFRSPLHPHKQLRLVAIQMCGTVKCEGSSMCLETGRPLGTIFMEFIPGSGYLSDCHYYDLISYLKWTRILTFQLTALVRNVA